MYNIKVYVGHGYFQYSVDQMESAMDHAHTIMQSGVYRRSNRAGDVEFHKVLKVKVSGDGLLSEYLDNFKRT